MKEKKPSWTRRIPRYLMLLLVMLIGTQAFSQKISWNSGFPKLDRTTLTALSDTGSVDVYFTLTQTAITTAKIEVKLPANVAYAGFATGTGHTAAITFGTATLSGTVAAGQTVTIPVNGGTLNIGLPVYLQVKATAQCAAVSGTSTVRILNNTTALVDAADNSTTVKDVPVQVQKPTIRLTSPASLISYANQGDINTFTLNMDAQNGQAGSFKVMLKVDQYSFLQDFKLDGTGISPAAITKARSGTDTIYTITFTESLMGGKLGATAKSLTFDAGSARCGSRNIATSAQYPAASNCNTNTGATLTMAFPTEAGSPAMTYVGHTYLDPVTGNNATCWDMPLDGVTPGFIRQIYKNTGSAAAHDISAYIGQGETYNHYLSFLDTTNIYYKINATGVEKRITKDMYVIDQTLTETSHRYPMATHLGKPMRLRVTIPDVLNVNDSLIFRFAFITGKVYDNTGKEVMYPGTSAGIRFYGLTQGITANNRCGVAGTNIPHVYVPNTSVEHPMFLSKPNDLSFRSQASKEHKFQLSTGADMSTVRNSSVDVYVQLPSWLSLDGAAITDAIRLGNFAGTTFYPFTDAVDHGNGLYSVRTQTSTNNYLYVNLKSTTCPNNTDNYDTVVTYWLNFNPNDGSNPLRPTLERVSQAFQNVHFLCKEEGAVLEDFTLTRTTKGLKDSDNDSRPDDGTIAPDNEIDHYSYMTNDEGYVTWNVRIAGNSSNTYEHLYTLLSTEKLSFGPSGYILPDTANQAAKIKIGSNSYPIAYKLVDAKHIVLSYDYTIGMNTLLQGGDLIEIKLPFKERTGINKIYSLVGECFVSNIPQADPLNPNERYGEDKLPVSIGLYDADIVNRIFSAYTYTMNMPNSGTYTTSAIYANYWNTYMQPPYFKNEYRNLYQLKKVVYTVPEGYLIDQFTLKYSGRDSSYARTRIITPESVENNAYTYDFLQFFDTLYDGSNMLAAGKWMRGDDRQAFELELKITATRGAPIGSTLFNQKATYFNYTTNTESTTNGNTTLNYSGMSTTMATSATSIPAYGQGLSMPSVMVGNPNNQAINNVWLYVEGNVAGLKITNLSDATTSSGVGYQGRWVKVNNSMANGTSANYRLDFNYTGGTSCAGDTVKVYTVTGFETTWNPQTGANSKSQSPAINYVLDKNDVNHIGAVRQFFITSSATAIAGNLSVSNDTLKYNTVYKLTAEINSLAGQGALANGRMDITIPAGQQYVNSSARMIYAANTTPVAVPAAIETVLRNYNNLDNDSIFTFSLNDMKGAGFMLPGYLANGIADSLQRFLFTADFKPMCATKLTGIRFTGTLKGSTACGDTNISGYNRRVIGSQMFSNIMSNYTFNVKDSMASNNRAFNELRMLDTLIVTLNKTSGNASNMQLSDSLLIEMPSGMNINGAVSLSSSVAAFNGTAGQGRNSVNAGTRSVYLTLPVAAYNGASQKGVGVDVVYRIPVKYTPNGQTLASNPEHLIESKVLTFAQLDPICNAQQKTVGNGNIGVALLTAQNNPQQACLNMPSTLQITSDAFAGKWYKEAAKTTVLSATNTLVYIPKVQQDTMFYVSSVFGSTDYGVVPVKVSMNPQTVAGFKSDSVCLGLATTFTDTTKVGGSAPAAGTQWNWYADGSATPFSTTKAASTTFSAAGNHTVKLVVVSADGCMDSVSHMVYVKPRANVSFTANPNPVCANVNVIFNNTSAVVGGTATYVHHYGDGQSDATGIHAYTSATGSPYTAKLVATTNLGCSDSTTQNITVYANTPVTIAQPNPELCMNGTMTFSANLTGGTWASTNTTVATINAMTGLATAKATGSCKIAYTFTNSNGCKSTDTATLTVNALPSVTTRDTSLCSGNSVNLTTLVNNPNSYALNYYTVQTGGSSVPNSIYVSTPVATDYYVEAVNSTTTCISGTRAKITVTGKSIPTISATPASQIKNNGELSDLITFTSVPSGATFSWTNSDATIGILASGTTGTISPKTLINTSGTDKSATITATATLNGCTSVTPANHVITIKAKTPYSLSPNTQTVCNGATTQAVTLSSASNNVTYNWVSDKNIGQGGTSGSITATGTTGIFAGFTATNATNTAETATFKIVPVSGTNAIGDTTMFTITVNPTPAVTLKGLAVCSGSSVNLTQSILSLQNTTLSEVKFSTSKTAFIADGIVDPMNYKPTVTGKVYVRVSNSNTTCSSAIDSLTVTVNALPSFTVSGQSVCTGGSVDLSASVSNLTPNKPNTVVSYSTLSGAGFDMGIIGNAGGYLPVSNTMIYVRATDSNSCVSATKNFLVRVNPVPTFTAQNLSICNGQKADLTSAILNLQNAKPDSVEYNTSSSFAVGSKIATPASYAIASAETIYVRAKSDSNCMSASSSFTVTVKSLPKLSSDKRRVLCTEGSLSYNAVSTVAGTSYTWLRNAKSNINNNQPMSGSGSQITETLTNSGSTTDSVYYLISMNTNGCNYTDTLTVVINPKAALTSTKTPSAICNGAFAYTPAYNISGTTYSWARAEVAGIEEAATSGSAAISETLTNSTASAVEVTYAITSTTNGCSRMEEVKVEVKPTPVLSSSLSPASICSGTTFGYTASSATKGVSYTWVRLAASGITPASTNGTGNQINETLTSANATSTEVKYEITLTANGCSHKDTIVTVVNPSPKLSSSSLTASALCSGNIFSHALTSATGGVKYNWYRLSSDSIDEVPVSGVSSNIMERLSNNSETNTTVSYVVQSESGGCMGNSDTVRVVVNALPTAVITSPTPMNLAVKEVRTATYTSNGTLVSWMSNLPSVATVDNTGKVTAVAEGIATITLTVKNTDNCTRKVSFVVNVSAEKLGSMSLASGASSQVCNQTKVPMEVTITGGKAPFTVVYNDGTQDITVTANSSIHRFMATPAANTGTSKATTTFTLKKITDSKGDTVTILPSSVAIEVNPVVTVNSNLNAITVCEGSVVSVPAFTSASSNVSYQWVNNNLNTGLSLSGEGNVSQFQAQNPTSGQISSTIKIRPLYSDLISCAGRDTTITINVNPQPEFMVMQPEAICAGTSYNLLGDSLNIVQNRQPVGAIKFYSDAACSTPVSGNVSINKTTTYYVKVEAVCPSAAQAVVVTVSPKPQADTMDNQVLCNNSGIDLVLTGKLSGATYKWVRKTNHISSGLPSSGSNMIKSYRLHNASAAAQTDTIEVTPEYSANGISCSGTATLFTITVQPTPVLSNGSLLGTAVCSGEESHYAFSSLTGGVKYHWERLTTEDIAEAVQYHSDSSIIKETLTNLSTRTLNVRYAVTLEKDGCVNTQYVTIPVHATPVIAGATDAGKVCSGSEFRYAARSTSSTATISWARLANVNIEEAVSSGSSHLIAETLTNKTTSPVAVQYALTFTSNSCSHTDTISVEVGAKLMLSSPTTSSTICSGNVFSYKATAAATGVQFSWYREYNALVSPEENSGRGGNINERLTNLSDTAVEVVYHIVMTTAEGCTAEDTIKVTLNELPTISLSRIDNPVCPNALEVTIPYTTTESNLEYRVTFSAKALEAGFQNMATFVAMPSDSIRIPMAEGVEPQRYQGTIEVRYAGCSGTSSYNFVINVLKPLEITQQPEQEIITCGTGGDISLSVKAQGTGLSYQWYLNGTAIANADKSTYSKSGITAADFGTYYVEVSNQCGTVRSESSEVHDNVVKIGDKWGTLLFVYGADSSGSSHGFATYQWYKANSHGELTAILDEADAQYYQESKGLNGSYAVKITYADGTSRMSCPVSYSKPKAASFKVYPNPVMQNATMTVTLENGNDIPSGTLTVYDMQGKRVLTTTISETATKLQLDVPTGVYAIHVVDAEGNQYTEKIIVR